MMKIRVIQPPYPKYAEDTLASVSFMIDQLRRCDESLDLILLPECCNAPCGCGDSSLLRRMVSVHTQPLLDAVQETAIRCRATVGINLYVPGEGCEGTVRNSTLLYDRQGKVAARYDKQHLPVSEYTNDYIDHSYLIDDGNPFSAEVDGVRYAFLTCYDMYYAEMIHRISLEKPDVVLICSLQRAERPDILEMQGKNTAFVCNSYVVRSSFHMGEGARTGACSMIVSPDGVVLRNFGQQLGSFDCEVADIRWKYRRSNGFGQPEVTNDVYQTLYRTPWCYRPGGSGTVPDNRMMPFPRLCADRGFPKGAPENSLPGIGIAVALGASEVAVDVCADAEGTPVLSDTGGESVYGYEELDQTSLEAVFKAFPRRAVFQLRLCSGISDVAGLIRKIWELARRYDCADHFYLASRDADVLETARKAVPDTERCFLPQPDLQSEQIVAEANRLGCTRIQTERLSEALVCAAHQAGIRCGGAAASAEEAACWLAWGADWILADNYLAAKKKLGIR